MFYYGGINGGDFIHQQLSIARYQKSVNNYFENLPGAVRSSTINGEILNLQYSYINRLGEVNSCQYLG